MSKIKPNSVVTLYSGVDITAGVQILFRNKSGQNAYFAKKVKYGDIMTSKKFTYLRRGGKLKLQMSTSQISECDYMSFRNPAFENKEFYAKIVNYEYISNTVTEITYVIDDFQTYMFDVKYEWGLIGREHLSESDYQKSLSNPYDPSIYEFQTAESIYGGTELEINYSNEDGGIQMYPLPSTTNCYVFQIANFDTSEFENIQTDFYDLFDNIIASDGTVIKGSGSGDNVVVGRGYGIYQIFTSSSGLTNAQKAMDWLTYQGLTGQVIGHFQISLPMWQIYRSLTAEDTHEIVPREYDVENKKLLLFPYQYLRVYNNEGDCKEYKYEYFNTVNDGSNPVAKFKYVSMFDGVPMVSLIPVDYRRSGMNPEERIDCHQIPMFGYCTDSYLAFVASQMQMNIGNRTATFSEGAKEVVDSLSDVAGRDLNYKSGYTPGLQGLKEMGSDFATGLAQAGKFVTNNISTVGNVGSELADGNFVGAVGALGGAPTVDLRNEQNSWRSGNNYPTNGAYLSPAKPAYVAYDYNPGSTNGTLGYHLDNPYPAGTYTFVKVKLRDSVLKVFDDYFSGYGYTSNRLGLPRVCNYISGKSSDLPHFSDYQGKKITYVKTSNMHVDHTLASVSASIEDMFNTGCQFLKGEDL